MANAVIGEGEEGEEDGALGMGMDMDMDMDQALLASSLLASEAEAKQGYDGDEYERLMHATLMAGFLDGGAWVAEGGRLEAEAEAEDEDGGGDA